MTDSEQVLWRGLRRKHVQGVAFYRQKPLGRYIVDFYGPAAKLVIEVDGSQHQAPTRLQRDAERELYLRHAGLRVLRFDDRQVLQELDGVMEVIEQAVASALGKIPPSPPFPKGGDSESSGV